MLVLSGTVVINKFLSLLIKVNEYYCFFPYEGSYIQMNGTGNFLVLPFSTKDIIKLSNKGTDQKRKPCFLKGDNKMFFEEGTFYDLKINVRNDVYIYPISEVVNFKNNLFRELNNKTKPIVIAGTLSKYMLKNENRYGKLLHPISANNEKGYIKFFLSNEELMRISEIGIINLTQSQILVFTETISLI